MQPKLDGYRCLVKIDAHGDVELISRSGRLFDFPQIESDIMSLGLKDCWLDGELYVHRKSFQQVSRLIKREDPSVKLYLYDMIWVVEEDMPWRRRRVGLESLLQRSSVNTLVPVDTITVRSQSEVTTNFKKFRDNGYEGGIIRKLDAPYKFNGRSANLIKVKLREDAEFLVTDIVMSEKGRAKGGAIFVCANDINDESFNCAMKRQKKDDKTFELRREIYDNREEYIGKIITVEFHGRSDKGIPREPVAKCFRDPIDME